MDFWKLTKWAKDQSNLTLSLWLYYGFFGKFLFHIANFSCQDLILKVFAKFVLWKMRICQKSHNTVTVTVYLWFEFLWNRRYNNKASFPQFRSLFMLRKYILTIMVQFLKWIGICRNTFCELEKASELGSWLHFWSSPLSGSVHFLFCALHTYFTKALLG